MSAVRRILSSLAAAAAILSLAACAGLPSTGPVLAGQAVDDDQGPLDVSFRPNAPQAGMTPAQIVQGFIDAGTSPEDTWAIAQLYLAEGADWDPWAGVTIDGPNDRDYAESAEDRISLTVTPVADVDGTGAYAVSDPVPTTLEFDLVQREDGEWRIAEAPDGIVLERDFFVNVFGAYPVMYFDQTWNFLVPDVRWFPARTNAPTRIAAALVDGAPSPWLEASVVSAFPEEVTLQVKSVTVDTDRIASVELSGTALSLPEESLDRMQAQLEASLAPAGVAGVEMSVDGTLLPATAAPTLSTRVDSRALVMAAGGFGFLVGDELQPLEGLSETLTSNLGSPAVAVDVAANQESAAVRVEDGTVARAQADGTVTDIDARPGLLDPSMDPFGYIWSVPAGEPSGIRASGVEDLAVEAWPEASQIAELRVSRDGARLAAIITVGGQRWSAVAGIVRTVEGAPVRVAESLRLGRLDGAGISLGWVDDTMIGIVTAREGVVQVTAQLVGGEASNTDGPPETTTLVGANGPSSIRLLDRDGVLYIQRGANWRQSASDITLLATQQGLPR